MQPALIIPVWNDRSGVERLLKQARRLDCFSEVIIVDDASMQPLEEDRLCRAWGEGHLRLFRQTSQQGAGAARNLALEHVSASHLMFFDSDDLLTPELVFLLRDLAGRDFDFCLFRHHDSRPGRWGRYGQMSSDDALWRLAGVATGALQKIDSGQATLLAGTINYPWNKIYRTDFLQKHDIRCAETPVHNDIPLHWLSFLHGRHILTSDRIAARHFVTRGGNRLTNRSGRERLSVFTPLRSVATATDGHPLMTAFLRFACNLFDWIRGILDPAFRSEFQSEMRHFLQQIATPTLFAEIVQRDPVLARRITLQLALERM